MHVAIVTETYPPEVNGVALTVQGLRTGLGHAGHRVSLVRPRQTPADRADDELTLLTAGAPIPRYPELRFGLPAAARLRRRWRGDRPDAVYIATEGPLGWSALRAARALDIPVAAGLHTRFDDYMRRYGFDLLAPLALAWMRRFHNRADRTLVPTVELAEFLRQRGFRHIAQLGRGVDCQQFDPARRDPTLRAAWGLGAEDPALIHVGRIAAEKNLPLLIASYQAVRQQHPAARLVLVGDGPERSALQQAHPEIVFCGVQRGAELGRHFASGDLFLFPSLSETFGNVTLEAMASGLPTVAFRYGAAREFVQPGRHGLTPSPDDAAGFVQAACALAGDSAGRRAMGLAARAAVLDCSPQRIADRFAHLLATLRSEESKS